MCCASLDRPAAGAVLVRLPRRVEFRNRPSALRVDALLAEEVRAWPVRGWIAHHRADRWSLAVCDVEPRICRADYV